MRVFGERLFSPLRRLLGGPGSRPLWVPAAGCCLFVGLIVGGTTLFLSQQRAQVLATREREIKTLSAVLAEQMDRSLQSIETVQTSLIGRMRQQGIDSEQDFVARMSDAGVHNLLQAQIKALPFVDKVALIGADGRVVNFSAYWPIPKINVSDRDYFVALKGDPGLQQFVSKPVKDRGTGAWSIFLARKFTSQDGKFLGVVLGAIYVSYFEDYFHNILAGAKGGIGLLRDDGVVLAGYPHAEAAVGGAAGTAFPAVAQAARKAETRTYQTQRGATAIVAASRLGHFPLLMAVSTGEAAALAPWRREATAVWLMAAIAIGAIAAIMFFVARSVRREIEFRNREASRRAERAEMVLRETIESIPEGFLAYDDEDRLVICNEAFRGLYPSLAPAMVPGATFAEILRRSLSLGDTPEAAGREEEWLAERLGEHRLAANTHEEVLADGRHILAIDRRTQSGLTAGIRLDVTALRTAEAQLHQAQKMDSIGQLSGGIAHDFNNLLGTIIGNLDLLVEDLPEDAALAGYAREALGASMRAGELTKRLLAFARKQPLRPQSVDVERQLGEITDLLRGTLGETVALELAIAEDLWQIAADPAQLESGIVNLGINARDAMPEGGRITIAARNVTLDGEDADLRPGDYVAIAITDTGSGMTAEVAARAFEPFFTTKSAGKGTGLGLSMVYGFAKQSKGHARIDSALGRGSTVTLYLPRAERGANVVPLPSLASRPARLPTGCEIVLLVEDNESLRQTTLRVLDGLGYRVVEAEDGPNALAILRSGEAIDLLFTDVVMPNGMSGFELAVEARRLRPDLKVLFASGFSEVAADARFHGNGNDAPLLTKPYRKDQVAWQVRSILDAA